MVRVKVRNKSNKKRSAKAIQELKDFTNLIIDKLGIGDKINIVRLNYTPHFQGYYPKGKPLYGFHKLFHNQQVTIDLTRHWDYSQRVRKQTIVHELTHVKQILDGRLKVSPNFRKVKWDNKAVDSWKKFRFKELDELSGKKRSNYLDNHLPWELEVGDNIKKFKSYINAR